MAGEGVGWRECRKNVLNQDTKSFHHIYLINFIWLSVCVNRTHIHEIGIFEHIQRVSVNGGLGDIVFFELLVQGAAADTKLGGAFFFIPVALHQDIFE